MDRWDRRVTLAFFLSFHKSQFFHLFANKELESLISVINQQSHERWISSVPKYFEITILAANTQNLKTKTTTKKQRNKNKNRNLKVWPWRWFLKRVHFLVKLKVSPLNSQWVHSNVLLLKRDFLYTKTKGLTTQMKALDEYILLVLFVLLLKRVYFLVNET